MGDELFDYKPGTDDSGVGNEEDRVNPFLANIPDNDRQVVEKYVKDWDAGVTKKFQSIHEQYAPFKGADPGEYQQAMQLFQLAQTDPVTLYNSLKQWVEANDMSDDNIEVMDDEDSSDDYSGLPESAVKQIKALRSQILDMNGKLTDKLTKDENERQLAELDKTMNKLHDKHGDFDDEAVLLRMRRGLDPEAAVKDYNQWLETVISSRTKPKPAFPTLGSNGGSPLGQVDRSKLNDSKVRKNLVADALAAAQGN